jgi:hypothetical protein
VTGFVPTNVDLTGDVAVWLAGQYDRAEADARAGNAAGVHGVQWRLDDIARKRAILADHPVTDGWDGNSLHAPTCGRCCTEDYAGRREGDLYPCRTVRLLAAEFADRPGHREEWRPAG